MAISVVIPYFNRSRFIDECLESVFRQTTPAAEIIVVDDASRPDERAYLDRFLPRIRIVDQVKNRGVAAARNAGIRAAQSEWIAFNDSDDMWAPEKLAIQTEHLAANPACDGVQSAVRAVYDTGEERISDPIPSRLALADTLHDNMLRVQTLMIRSAVLRATRGFDETMRCCEDDDLGIRLAAGDYRIDYLHEPLTNMRRGGHDHLFSDWRRIVRAKTVVTLKHRELLERVVGPGAARRRIARAMRKAGSIRGGVVGRLVFAGGWIAGGFDRATD